MRISVNYFRQQLHNHVKGGGKESRRNEVRKIEKFLKWASANTKANTPHGIGNRQVLDFYRAHAHLSERTLTDYWYAIASVWHWLDRPGKPPKPPNRDDVCRTNVGIDQERFSSSVGRLVLAARAMRGISIPDLACISGLPEKRIAKLESVGDDRVTLGECGKLLSALGVNATFAIAELKTNEKIETETQNSITEEGETHERTRT